jgi:putative PIN family toxin of toxin-antitoxin system
MSVDQCVPTVPSRSRTYASSARQFLVPHANAHKPGTAGTLGTGCKIKCLCVPSEKEDWEQSRNRWPIMVEVVIDTNVLVSAFRSSIGASYRLLQTLEKRIWRPVISPTLAFEYEAVLKRGTGDVPPTIQDIDDFIEYLCSRSRLVQIYYRWRPILPDADDDRILEVAVRSGSNIVTFNRADFRGADRFGVRIITPRELLTAIGEN